MTEINIFPKFLDKALSPAAESVGNTLSSVWSIVFGGIDSYSKKLEYKRTYNFELFRQELEDEVVSIPNENLVEPSLHVLGPALEASKYYIESEQLRKMFARLIASSMDSDKAEAVHPSYVEIIKQLSPDEAKILKYIKGNHFPTIRVVSQENGSHSPILEDFTDISFKADCEFPNKIHAYLENLNRLGLIKLHFNGELTNDKLYKDIEDHPVTKQAFFLADSIGQAQILRTHAAATQFGRLFYDTCIR